MRASSSEQKTLVNECEANTCRCLYKLMQRVNVCLSAALKRQYLELLSMLNVKEQRIYQATKPQYSLDTESGVLEVRNDGGVAVAGWNSTLSFSATHHKSCLKHLW